jgi:hypothetical protein
MLNSSFGQMSLFCIALCEAGNLYSQLKWSIYLSMKCVTEAVQFTCSCRCVKCNGKGKLPCAICGSRGLLKCETCSGSGSLLARSVAIVKWYVNLLASSLFTFNY